MAEATANAGGVTRREFLYYIWGASLALFLVETTGLTIWFMLPRFKEGQFGGSFKLPVDLLPIDNAPPFNFPEGRFWLSNINSTDPNENMNSAPDEDEPIVGSLAIYKVCTHLGCIYNWIPANDRFECPCHGSKYRLDGRRIEAPAPRDLDRFKLAALDANDNVLAESQIQNGVYLPLKIPPETAFLQIDTGDKKQGDSEILLCSFQGNCP
jgi:cytochrome b6-f complex iron-sulfur subunit